MYCTNCGTLMKELPTKSSWEELQECPQCATQMHTYFGDSMGGQSDTIYITTKEERERRNKKRGE